MPDIHIHRDHHLGFKEARKVAFTWAEKAEEKFDMECVYEEGETEDLLTFTRTGVKGTLLVDAHQFEMKAQLGFLLGAFKDRIEAEISEQLDALLNAPHPAGKKTAADKKHPAADAKAAAKTAAKPAAAKAKKT
ncbi:polyhydroxyalkanoic acid system family protein [Acidovorax sp. FJL06]|uniref:polyhydroxyalkanoic acid system family protein n=1 Tax=Acidovorax sp. FJL06 TaxID=2153365 RepID=UPI000F55FF3C|nr:polyhydroxyalkanoic acid system family protein [Acidovorax sp. FJL06]RQO81933.1 polyhydroxyalkanoic acid synthase [Acidovorax sp. FJL06]